MAQHRRVYLFLHLAAARGHGSTHTGFGAKRVVYAYNFSTQKLKQKINLSWEFEASLGSPKHRKRGGGSGQLECRGIQAWGKGVT